MGRDTYLVTVVAGLTEPRKPLHPDAPHPDALHPASMTPTTTPPAIHHPRRIPAISRGLIEQRATPPEIHRQIKGQEDKGTGQVSTRSGIDHPLPIRAHSWLKILHPSLKTYAFKWNHE